MRYGVIEARVLMIDYISVSPAISIVIALARLSQIMAAYKVILPLASENRVFIIPVLF